MIRITRLLTFEQYAASTRLAHLRGRSSYKRKYIQYIYVFPWIALAVAPLLLWQIFRLFTADGSHTPEIAMWGGFSGLNAYYLCYPILFRKKMRKLYREQELNLPWTIEFSEQGIRNIHPGRLETRYEWAYFATFVETQELFLIQHPVKLAFVAVSKTSLKPGEEDELRTLLLIHLKPAGSKPQ